MNGEYIQYLVDTITVKDNLKLVKEEAQRYKNSHTTIECYEMALELYQSEYFQLQEVGTLLFGYISIDLQKALSFMREIISNHSSWKVQEVLAMAFDTYCKINSYKKSLPTIKDWLNDKRSNVRRAVSEGLRIWTNRDYFRENPHIAISLLSVLRNDESEYVLKSAGNALRDISKKYSDLVKIELKQWDITDKKTKQVYKLANKFLEKNVAIIEHFFDKKLKELENW